MIIASHQFVVGTIQAVEDWISTPYPLPGQGATHLLVNLFASNTDGSRVLVISALGTNDNTPGTTNQGATALDQTLVNDGITGDKQLFRTGGAGATITFGAPSPYLYLMIQVVPVETLGNLTDVVVTLTSIAMGG